MSGAGVSCKEIFMRVWVLGRGVPTKRNNLLGSFEFEQAQMLKRAGHEVYYFGVNIRSARDWDRFGYRYESVAGIETASFSFPLYRIMSPVRSRSSMKKIFLKMADKMSARFGAPDIIHVHYPAMWPYAAFELFQKNGVRIVATEHWSQVMEKQINDVLKENLSDFSKKCDALICVSSGLERSIRELTGTERAIYVIPNFVSSAFSVKSAPHKGFNFICVGRVIPLKQFDKVISAFLETFGEKTDAVLTVAGGGTDFGKLSRLVADAGAEGRVKLLGTVPREKMAEVMASADALICYSVYETFCVPIIEAWMSGKPVIVSSSLPLAQDNNDGRLEKTVDCNDTDTLKAAMLEMYEDHGSYDSEWIATYANERFSEQAVSKQLTDIYQQVMR